MNRKDFRPSNERTSSLSNRDREKIHDSKIIIHRDSNGYVTEYTNKNAKNSNTVYIAQTGKYNGFTAMTDNPKNKNKPVYLGHSIHAETLGRKYAKTHKKVLFRD